MIGHLTHPHTTLSTTNVSKVYFNPQHDRVPTFILVSRHHLLHIHFILYNERLRQKNYFALTIEPTRLPWTSSSVLFASMTLSNFVFPLRRTKITPSH